MSKTTDGETKTILKKLAILILVSVPRAGHMRAREHVGVKPRPRPARVSLDCCDKAADCCGAAPRKRVWARSGARAPRLFSLPHSVQLFYIIQYIVCISMAAGMGELQVSRR